MPLVGIAQPSCIEAGTVPEPGAAERAEVFDALTETWFNFIYWPHAGAGGNSSSLEDELGKIFREIGVTLRQVWTCVAFSRPYEILGRVEVSLVIIDGSNSFLVRQITDLGQFFAESPSEVFLVFFV